MANYLKSISQLDGLWRVDGVGKIKFFNNSVPRVNIYLTQIKRKGMHAPLVYSKTTGLQRGINEPLNRISSLKVGSCWEGGYRVNKLTPFEGVQFKIDTSRIRFCRPGDPIEIKGKEYPYALPPVAIKLGGNFKYLCETLYAVVPVLDNNMTDTLIVPCTELYQFYMGVSSEFSNNLVRNTLDGYVEWREPALRVKTRLSRLEQFVAYRGFFDEDGRDWFHMPSDHIRSILFRNNSISHYNQQPLVIKATFPFKGITTVTIAGKRFKYLNDNGDCSWAVFAANIIKCSYSVPFEPIIESDIYSSDIQPGFGQGDAGDLPSDSDFDEEEYTETDEPPNGRTRGIALINCTNRFAAMDGMKFYHVHPKEAVDPIYQNDDGESVDVYSYEDMENVEASDGVGKKSEYDSHVSKVERQLSDFVRMIIQYRGLVKSKKWEVVTRSCWSTLEVEGEIITAFLPSNNKRRTWHKIRDCNGEDRYRHIAWVEVKLKEDRFFYLVEMELKKSEKGRSTLLISPKDGKYMPEQDFELFLNMTAAKNRWPKDSHLWKGNAARIKAESYFSKYSHAPLSHPTYISDEDVLDEHVIRNWALDLERNINDKLVLE